MSKFAMCDIVKRKLPSNILVGEPMIVRGYICGKDQVVCIGAVSRKAALYQSHNLEKEPTVKILVSAKDYSRLEHLRGIGTFYHELSKSYDRIHDSHAKYVVFTHVETGRRLIYRLANSKKVIKTIGYEANDSHQPVRVGCPMIKLTFIGDLS